ncbi:hypothetical protein N9W41_01485 [bacterium]|nr:hypothetical protein [bacterium]
MDYRKNGLYKGEYSFTPSVMHGQIKPVPINIERFHYVELLWPKGESETEAALRNHWVILEMDTELIFENHFHIESLNKKDLNSKLSTAGYSPQFNNNSEDLTYSINDCRIHKTVYNDQVAMHDCDSSYGDSGAPIYKCDKEGFCQIFALHIGFLNGYVENESFTEHFSNYAVTTNGIHKHVKYLLHGGVKPSELKSVDNIY